MESPDWAVREQEVARGKAGHAKNARQITWVLLLKAHHAAGKLTGAASAVLSPSTVYTEFPVCDLTPRLARCLRFPTTRTPNAHAVFVPRSLSLATFLPPQIFAGREVQRFAFSGAAGSPRRLGMGNCCVTTNEAADVGGGKKPKELKHKKV
ncbi:hypothetical protein Zm00014a_013639 [Zea mays]|uniref:Uncharacterized protein n=1 Tax=Zea mays TaxID=4577 RepID=A0A3L6EG77_MAIZE|nr:hypothetical protein Zm00014a_013639 [Zea mays]